MIKSKKTLKEKCLEKGELLDLICGANIPCMS